MSEVLKLKKKVNIGRQYPLRNGEPSCVAGARTPSPVQYSTSSSSTVTPVSSHPNSADTHYSEAVTTEGVTKEKGPQLPTSSSFTVTSSATFVPQKTGTHTLNPGAKEFEISSSAIPYFYDGQLSAVNAVPFFPSPSAGALLPMTAITPATVTDYTASWNGTSSNRQVRLQTPTSLRGTNTLSPDTEDKVVLKMVEYIRSMYDKDCAAQGRHMVAVLNLESYTTHKDLSQMFFPMGASEAITLDATDVAPELTGSASALLRRRMGVVFFPKKDFAMVGVSKFDNFVPNGQHQPLIVRYCGPDTESSTWQKKTPWLLPSADLEKVHEEMWTTHHATGSSKDYMVAFHGLDRDHATKTLRGIAEAGGAIGCELWPPKRRHRQRHLGFSTSWLCSSVSAVVWYPSEKTAQAAIQALDGGVPKGQRQKVRAVLLKPPSKDSLYSTSNSSKDLLALGAAASSSGETNSLPAASKLNASSSQWAFHAPVVDASSPTSGAADTNDSVITIDEVDEHFVKKYSNSSMYLVGVHNLEMTTDKKKLYNIFYPIGALAAELYPSATVIGNRFRRSGVALFNSHQMALEAARRIHKFVPHGQSRPLITRYLERSPSTRKNIPTQGDAKTREKVKASKNSADSPIALASRTDTASAAVTAPQLTGLDLNDSTSLPQRPLSEQPQQLVSTPRILLSGPTDLLRAIEEQLSTPYINAAQLEELMVCLVSHPDATPHSASELAKLLANALIDASHHAVVLATPLSGSLLGLHERLGIQRHNGIDQRPSSANTSVAEQRGNDAHASTPLSFPRSANENVYFVKEIADTMMRLVTNNDIPRESRRVAAMLCAYFFLFTYLPSTPYAFAAQHMGKHQAELHQTREFLSREAGVQISTEEEKQHQPWVTLVECLQEMVSLWRGNYKLQPPRDEAMKEYEAYIADFYGNNLLHSVMSPSGSVSGCGAVASAISPAAGSRSCSSGQGCASTKRSPAMLTPSARPTPRRTTRVSPGNVSSSGSSGRLKQSTFTAMFTGGAASTIAPRVMLSPLSDNTQGVSADNSIESIATSSLAQTLRSIGLRPSVLQPPSALAQPWTPAGTFTPPPSAVFSSSNFTVAPRKPTSDVAATHRPQSVALQWEVPSSSLNSADGVLLTAAGRSTFAVNSRQPDATDCTVYITKLPSTFTSCQVRRLLLHFGELVKVRLCRDKKEGVVPPPNLSSSYNKLCFGFVEFLNSASAKAMVEFFRNTIYESNSFDFMLHPQVADGDQGQRAAEDLTMLTEDDVELLMSTRTSQARSPIHDHQPLDSILQPVEDLEGQPFSAKPRAYSIVRPCLFGIKLPHVTIDVYSAACQQEAQPTLQPPFSMTTNSNETRRESDAISQDLTSSSVGLLFDPNAAANSTMCSYAPMTPSKSSPLFFSNGLSATAPLCSELPTHPVFDDEENDLVFVTREDPFFSPRECLPRVGDRVNSTNLSVGVIGDSGTGGVMFAKNSSHIIEEKKL